VTRSAVVHSADVDRVRQLPRRAYSERDGQAWAAVLTPYYARPGADVALRPVQGFALAEAAELGGGFFALPVGQGKTLLTYLLPKALEATRALIVVPASLRNKTRADFCALERHWTPPRSSYQIISRDEVSRDPKLLETFAPDAIIIDEADDLSNPSAGATLRFDRYVVAHPDVRVVAMTGTPARKSILNYWHLLCWTLGDGAPVPLVEGEARMWAAVLDEGGPAYRRPRPGPLGATLGEAREWYRRRLAETPGVLIVDEDSCDQPLTLRTRYAREDSATDAQFERFLVEQENLGGIPVSDPLSRWLLDAQLGLGLYTYWDPPPPERWRSARRNVARFVRDRVARSQRTSRPLDTEGQVLARYADDPIVREWLAVKPTFAGTTAVEWFSAAALASVEDWLEELGDERGVVWCGCVPFAERLAERTRLEYYSRGGRSAGGAELHEADGTRHLIASWNANKKGFNLQAWRRALVVMPPQSAKWLEQTFGRHHRAGQTRPVEVDVLLTSGGTLDAFRSAYREARFVRSTVALTQKILRARIEGAAKPSDSSRWATRDDGAIDGA